MKKRKHKTAYPQWTHPAGAYGDFQPVRRILKCALKWIALLVCFLILVVAFILALSFCFEFSCISLQGGLDG